MVKTSEVLIYDEEINCPYILGRQARMPMRSPIKILTRQEFNLRLQNGDRRNGIYLYKTKCKYCIACESIRVNVNNFVANKTQRRVYNKGLKNFEVKINPVGFSEEKLAIYNRHKSERKLGIVQNKTDFQSFIENTCCETFEIQYRIDNQLIGVAIVDRAENALSAVYFYFNPDFEKFSPGVFSILTQIELCRKWELQFLYLGTYNKQNPHVVYKHNYLPHERLINGTWIEFVNK